jgi:hypothetical protein
MTEAIGPQIHGNPCALLLGKATPRAWNPMNLAPIATTQSREQAVAVFILKRSDRRLIRCGQFGGQGNRISDCGMIVS